MSARKARLVLDLIRGRTVPEARTMLAFTPRAAAREIEPRARARPSPTPSRRTASTATSSSCSRRYADEGPTLKRWRARARGRVNRIKQAHLPHHRSSSPPWTSRAASGRRPRKRTRDRGVRRRPAEAKPKRRSRSRRSRRWPRNGPEGASRRPPRRRHPRLEVELVHRQEGDRRLHPRGHPDPRPHQRQARARRAVRHPDPQGQAADHRRHLHRAPGHRDRQVGRRGGRAPQGAPRDHRQVRPHQHQRDQASRARRAARRAVDRRAAPEPRRRSGAR